MHNINSKYHDSLTHSLLSPARNMHNINPLKTQLNLICHLLALLGAHPILHVSRIKVNSKYHDSYTYVHYQLLGICTILIRNTMIHTHSLLSTARNMHNINPLKTQLNLICHLLALLGAHPILHVSRIRVN